MTTSYEPHSIIRLPTGTQHELHDEVSLYIFSLVEENDRLRMALRDIMNMGMEVQKEEHRKARAALFKPKEKP